MATNDGTDKRVEEGGNAEFYSISSKSARQPRTLSFSVPTLRRPQLKTPTGGWRNGVIAVLFILISVVSGTFGGWLESHNQTGLVSGTVGSEKKVVTSQGQLISQIAKTVGPSVVSVNVDISSSSSGSSSSGGFGLFGFSQPENEEAAGTGIIISSDGLIITNRHVVPAGTTSVSVTLSDGTELKNVSVIGRTSDSDSLDIAFLKVNDTQGHKLTPAVIGDSSTVQVGDNVVAIGNALGQFQNTVTSGIISGYGRSVQATDSSGDASSAENLDDLFQTDAAINEGNSGGPLVNLNGQVIGINTATAGDAQNIGFAIPINDVRGLITQVLKTGKFARPYLGVEYIPLTADVANEYNLSVQNGAFIAPSSDPSSPSVISGSPAANAGLQENDIITAVNGTNIDQTHSLTSLLDQHQPGDKITLTILRGTKTLNVSVTLGTAPSS
ncbi:MAG TPA: trypsin-like peptidase domain-containing protein [Verrucomicrobiae bacterium]|jgi:serine protease Do|nr:trypsin-like peptidase domain-containing protein [Verrucomicrobiae bacterium]